MNICRKEQKNLTDYIGALYEEVEILKETIDGLDRYKFINGKHRKGNVQRLFRLRNNVSLLKVLIEDLEQVDSNMNLQNN